MLQNNKKMQSGASLYLAVMIMTILLAIVLGLSTISFDQIAILRGMGYSVIAFYAADAGIERALLERENPQELDGLTETLANGSIYTLFVYFPATPECSANNFCIKSIGAYQKTSRAIEINY